MLAAISKTAVHALVKTWLNILYYEKKISKKNCPNKSEKKRHYWSEKKRHCRYEKKQ